MKYATCGYCNLQMNGAACTVETFDINGGTYQRIPFRIDWDENIRVCNDCGTVYGHLHHPRCDLEECPRCHQQLIGCGCLEELLPR